jgi:hypothetical protein
MSVGNPTCVVCANLTAARKTRTDARARKYYMNAVGEIRLQYCHVACVIIDGV